jgi:hypothetical protein
VRKPGKTKIALARFLEEAIAEIHPGIPINPQVLWSQEGYYRNRNLDLARWGAFIPIPESQGSVCVYSWDTMTACVKHGIVIAVRRDNPNEIEVSSKQ